MIDFIEENTKTLMCALGAILYGILSKEFWKKKLPLIAMAFVLAQVLSAPISIFFHAEVLENGFAFVIGFLSMNILEKIYEIIFGLNVKKFWEAIFDAIKGRLS